MIASFSRLRELLLSAGYDRTQSVPAFSSKGVHPWLDHQVAERARGSSPAPLACHSRPSRFWRALPEPLQTLYRVLYLHEEVPVVGLEPLVEVGLLEGNGSTCVSRVQVTAVPGGRFIISSVPSRTPGPFVYLGDDSGHLIEAALCIPGRRALDMCCGCGVVGLCLPESFTQVHGLDANPRGIEMARWNAQLNGSSARFEESDLWAGAEGLYDLVIGNPPALPIEDPRPDLLFARGGPRPTELTCRTVAGLPDHLAPGGRCLLLSFSVGHALWDDLLPLVHPTWSLHLRVRASHPLPKGRVLHHVWVDVRHDGRGERLRSGQTLRERLRGWAIPWAAAEKPAQKSYLLFRS